MKFALKKILAVAVIGMLALFSSLAFNQTVAAQEFKVGYIDPRAVMQRMPEAKAIQQQIQNLYEKKQNEIANMQQKLQSELEEYQQKVGVISDDMRLSEEERLSQMDFELRQLQSDAEQEIQQKSAELMEPLFEQIQTSVDNVAELQGLDMVLNLTMGGYSFLESNIIYVSAENKTQYDITSEVMQDLGI